MTASIVATVEPRNSAHTDSGLRVYQWGDIECLSVTTIRTLLGSPHPLVQWRINNILDRAINDPTEYAAQAADSETALRRWLRDGEARKTLPGRITEAERGTMVHQAIEYGLKPNQCTDEVRPYMTQFYAMKRAVGFDIVLQERQVWNLSARYAGTFDALVRTKDGTLVLPDWKTAKEAYLDYVMQAHAYLGAEFVGNDGVVDEEATALLNATTRGAVAIIHPDSWEWVEFDFDPRVYRAWLGTMVYAQYVYENPDLAKVYDRTMKGSAA